LFTSFQVTQTEHNEGALARKDKPRAKDDPGQPAGTTISKSPSHGPSLSNSLGDGDQDQEEIKANNQGLEEVEAQVEDAQEVISPPHRLTRSKFKELGDSGRLFSLFIVSFVLKGV